MAASSGRRLLFVYCLMKMQSTAYFQAEVGVQNTRSVQDIGDLKVVAPVELTCGVPASPSARVFKWSMGIDVSTYVGAL
jgi:hypothetical protein